MYNEAAVSPHPLRDISLHVHEAACGRRAMFDVSLVVRSLRRRLATQPRLRMALYALSAAASTLLLRLTQMRTLKHSVRLAPVSELLKSVENGRVHEAVVMLGACAYRLADGELCRATLLPADTKLLVSLLHRHSVPYRAQGPPGWRAALVILVPFAYLGMCGWLLHRMTSDSAFGGGSDVTNPPAAASGEGESTQAVGWDDVAGLPGIKSAVMEVVDVMQRPQHYARLGARCPRGVLLAGPPGTGKTLLARAVATEAGVPFLACTGSDFVEVFVGRGARRVRSLFEDAARHAPCVLFIDELDAIGSSRSARGLSGGSEEHDQTLNQLLALMDGLGSSPGILVMAATNRLTALDPALTRPGRFDRVLQLTLPDEDARMQILRVHAAKTALENGSGNGGGKSGGGGQTDAILRRIARETSGFSGAELAGVVNEAAIAAVRAGDEAVRSSHLERAVAEFKVARTPMSEQATWQDQEQADGPVMSAEMEAQLRAGVAMLRAMGVPGRPSVSAAGARSVVEENE